MKKRLFSFVFVCCVCLFLFVTGDDAYAAGQTTMYVGETETFNANINTYKTIKSYSWTISGSGATILNKSAHSCQVAATSSGKSTLNYSVTSTYTYYIYTDVQRTKKKYITNTQVNRASWVITAGTPVTVTFDAGGGSVDTNSKTVACGGEAVYGELPAASYSGYVFDGWYTAKTGGTLVTSATKVSKNTPHTLYAHWIENFSYTIHFDGNGSTGGTMQDMICQYGESHYLTNNAFVKKGNRFAGWSTTQDGSGTKFANKKLVKNLRKTAGTVTLYAVWSDENIASGTHGENLTWIIDAEGTLIISGNGAMSAVKPSWHSYIEKINKVVMEEGITTISEKAFSINNNTIKAVVIPNTVTTISAGAFWACRGLESVNIPDSVTYIGQNAFYNCNSLSSVTLGNGVKTIGENAFGECNFKKIHIPASVTYIGGAALSLYSLKEITVAEGNAYFCSDDGILFDKSKTTLIAFPFGYGKSTYMIPDGVTTIGDGAFQKTGGTKTIIFPESVSVIGLDCFCDNTLIRHLYFRGGAPSLKKESLIDGAPASSAAFNNVTATIYYPSAKSNSWVGVKGEYNSACLFDSPTFTWTPYTLNTSMQNCTIQRVDDEIYSYDGKEKQPSVIVYDQGMMLYEGKDYEISYSNNVNAGENTAKVMVSGLNNYADTTNEIAFSIEKAQQMPIFAIESETVKAGDVISVESAFGYGEITYLSKSPTIASISQDGVISGLKVGSAVIEITATGDSNHESGTEQLKIQVIHNNALVPDSISAEKKALQSCIGEKIDLSDLVVKATYSDGYTGEVSGYTTNAEAITVSTIGKKTLNITYKENGKTVETSLIIEIIKHKEAAPIVENQVAATTKKAGSYDQVVYCTKCKKELSRKQVIIPRMLAKGEKVTDKKSGGVYVVTKASAKSGTVEYKKPRKKTTKIIRIPDTITVNGVSYKVTSIAKNAFKNNKYVTKVTIGKNVKKIGANAFYNCKRLKTITIYTTKLKMSTVGKNAFKGVKKNAVVKVPKAKYSLYKKVLKKRGISKVAKFKKM